MAQQKEMIVRRAKPKDAHRIAAFVSRASPGRPKVDRQKVIDRFGSVGFLLAERDDAIVGMLGWQAENLVVRVTDLLVQPASERLAATQALLSEMERAADELQCEAALLLPPHPPSPDLIEFSATFGYEPQIVADLPRAWHDAAHEAQLAEEDTVLVKQVREKRVIRPL